MKSRLLHTIGACAIFWGGTALAGPMAASTSSAGGVPTLQRLVQNLGQSQVQGLLGSPSRHGEVSLYLQSPAASVPGGGLSMVYVVGTGFLPDTNVVRTAGQRALQGSRPVGRNVGFGGTDYSLGQTLGVSVSELGNYLYVVHVPFNIAIKDRYTDPGPADNGGLPVVVVPAPSSTTLGLLGLVLIGAGLVRIGHARHVPSA